MFKIFSKRFYFLLLIIISDLIIALRAQREFFYYFFWFLLSFTAISFIWVGIEYYFIKLQLERKMAGKIEEDDILEVNISIKNKSYLPMFNFILEDYAACAITQDRQKRFLLEYLGPGSEANLQYQCRSPLRGKYKIGPFCIYIFDPLGFFFLKKAYFIYSDIYVYPRTFNIKTMPPLRRGIAPWFDIDTTHVSGDEHEFYGIREYRRGDPIKKIHWLTTARKNKLIIKQFQHQIFFRVTILFNLSKEGNFGKGKDSIVEYTIKIAASVAKYYIQQGISLEVIAHTGEIVHIPFNKGAEHLDNILKFLTVAQAESRVNLGEIFEEFSKHIPTDSSLIVIMPDRDWEHLFRMLAVQSRNISLLPLILVSSSFLGSFEKDKAIADVYMKLPQKFGSPPIFLSCGENLAVPFLNISLT